jgi:hypothetical protein
MYLFSLHELNRIRKRSIHFVQDIGVVVLFDEQIKHKDRRTDDRARKINIYMSTDINRNKGVTLKREKSFDKKEK